MNQLKKQLQQKLLANLFADICEKSEMIIFQSSWCSQERIIRFTTPLLKDIYGGDFESDTFAIYEVTLGSDSFSVQCLKKLKERDDLCVLNEWPLVTADNPEMLCDKFQSFLCFELKNYEETLSIVGYTEGTMESAHHNKYERNQKAREACLNYYGTVCVLCGMDFEKSYGKEFAGKIEVHHIVPISSIGKEYVVDPIRDLIPLCPNCHMAIHSKKDGVYTMDEMRAFRKTRK